MAIEFSATFSSGLVSKHHYIHIHSRYWRRG